MSSFAQRRAKRIEEIRANGGRSAPRLDPRIDKFGRCTICRLRFGQHTRGCAVGVVPGWVKSRAVES